MNKMIIILKIQFYGSFSELLEKLDIREILTSQSKICMKFGIEIGVDDNFWTNSTIRK